jgi:hypothetical protein
MLLENKNAAVYGAGGSLPSWRAAAGDSAGSFEGAPYGSDVSFFGSAPSVRSACGW